MTAPVDVARLSLPTVSGPFVLHAFEVSSGRLYLALVAGDVAGLAGVLTRLHSECLTGDALGSLRCDCGAQLRAAMRTIVAEGSGIVLYATGQEGRGIGLLNKLRAYVLQDAGADTVDANLALGLPVDARDYGDAAAVLRALGVRSVRLLTNNPAKRDGLEAAGMPVEGRIDLTTVPHVRNVAYLRAKHARMEHAPPWGGELDGAPAPVGDVTALLGEVRPTRTRPYVVVKLAQTLDGRLATSTGDSRWISGEGERRVSHALRAASDAVMVGVGTVLADDPRLTVRLVPGPSPLRVVLDTRLRTPPASNVVDDAAPTLVYASREAAAERGSFLRALGVGIRSVGEAPGGVDVAAVLADLRRSGVTALLVEGGARVVTTLLARGLVDRAVVSVSPIIVGAGRDAVGDLGITRISDAVRLEDRSVHVVGSDVIVAGDVAAADRALDDRRRSTA